jgi:hypothetical protein
MPENYGQNPLTFAYTILIRFWKRNRDPAQEFALAER